jgi:hypothetical protein
MISLHLKQQYLITVTEPLPIKKMGNGLKVATVSFTSNRSKETPLLYKSNLPTTALPQVELQTNPPGSLIHELKTAPNS